MIKRKEFMLGAVAGLTVAAAATAGGVIDWPTAEAQVSGVSGRIVPTAGMAGAAFAPPQGAPRSFADIFEQVAPAVVQINVESRITGDANGTIQIPGTPFRIPVPQPEEGEEAPTNSGAGSGFFISADGYIVTNNHVVADAVEITVTLADGRELEAELVGRDRDTDLAVIKVQGGDFPFVTFEEEAQPRVGDWVIAVGNPFGLGGTATAGIVSATAREVPEIAVENPYTDFLQIDAAINVGNSGGPTFDIYGRVIGVNTAIYGGPSRGSVGIGFAIPASIAKPVTEQLIRSGTVERGYLGAQVGTVSDPEVRGALGLPDGLEAATIEALTPGAPAARAGLRVGDIVTAINGEDVEGSNELTRIVGAAAPGDTLRLEVLRDGRRQTINVRAGTRPADVNAALRNPQAAPSTPNDRGQSEGEVVLGMTITPIPSDLRQRYGLTEADGGVVVTAVADGSTADEAGVQQGLAIQSVSYTPVRTVAEFRAAVEAARRAGRPSVLLSVRAPTGQSGRLVVPFQPAD